MTATIIKFPQRPRNGWLCDDPHVKKAVACMALVSLEAAKLTIAFIEEWERTHPPPAA